MLAPQSARRAHGRVDGLEECFPAQGGQGGMKIRSVGGFHDRSQIFCPFSKASNFYDVDNLIKAKVKLCSRWLIWFSLPLIRGA
jgi:hypothetical protein